MSFSQPIIEEFFSFLESHPESNISVSGNFWTNNARFLSEIINNEKFAAKNILKVDAYDKKTIKKILEKNMYSGFDYIVVFSEIFPYSELHELLEKNGVEWKIIFSNIQKITHKKVKNFTISEVSFREYSEKNNEQVVIADILAKKSDISALEKLAEDYLMHGAFIENIDNPDGISEAFDKKCAIIDQELFEKEREEFKNFIRTIALEVGQLHKEDAIAKNMNISRRKVRKFMDLLVKYDVIKKISSFTEDSEKELSRHDKVYFSDLSYFRGAMGENYHIGAQKKSVIENFVFLELSRKLDETHELLFWKKKSGAELSFVLKNKETNGLTPIEIEVSAAKNISLALKSFYESYGERVEHGMLLNEKLIDMRKYHEKTFFVLPYYTI